MRSESEVFSDLKELCGRPGYIHVLAAICFRDNMIAYAEEMTSDDYQKMFDPARLIRTEITSLIGLMVQGEIKTEIPKPQTFQSYIDKTDELMKEIHEAMTRDMIAQMIAEKSENPDVIPDPFSKGDSFREPIFYGGESAYSFQYRDLAAEKYLADNDWLKANKGFSVDSARVIVNAIGSLQNEKIGETINGMKRTKPETWTVLPGYYLDESEIAEESGVGADEVKAFIDAFTLKSKNTEFKSLSDFNATAAEPILCLEDGRKVLLQYYSIAEAFYDSPFYWMISDKSYRSMSEKNRGDFTEEFSAKRLAKVFGHKNVLKNVRLGNKKETLGEIDVLVTFGDRLVIVQAKSKRLTIEARKGNDGQLKDDFKKAIQDSYDQGLICAHILLAGNCKLYDVDGNEFSLPHKPKEIFLFNVVSDHYPALSFQASQFLKFAATDEIKPPFVMDIFLLDAMTEMLETPLRLLGYIRQRVQYMDRLQLSHELTALSYHLHGNMWFSDEADMVMLGDDISVDLDVAMSVRRDGLPGARTPEGILTRFSGTRFESLLHQIEHAENPATLDLGFLLLTFSGETCNALNDGLDQLVSAVKADGKPHDFVLGVADGGEGVTIHCNWRSMEDAAKRLEAHCIMRKYSQKAERWFGICIDLDMNIRFGMTIEFPWGHSAEMDAHIAQFLPKRGGALPARHVPATQSRKAKAKRKIGRNEPCPCGSGAKYKKCCLRKGGYTYS